MTEAGNKEILSGIMNPELLQTHGVRLSRPSAAAEPARPGVFRRRNLAVAGITVVLAGLGLKPVFEAMKVKPLSQKDFRNGLEMTDLLIAEGRFDQAFRNSLERYFRTDGNGGLWAGFAASGGLKHQVDPEKDQPPSKGDRKVITYQFLESPSNPQKPFINLVQYFNPFTLKLEVDELSVSLLDLGVMGAGLDINRVQKTEIYQRLNPVLVDCPQPDAWFPGSTTGQVPQTLAASMINSYPAKNGSRVWQRDYKISNNNKQLVIKGSDVSIGKN